MDAPSQPTDVQEEINRLVKILHNQKEKVIKQRLKKLRKLNILKNIKTRRFKKLLIEHYNNCEKVYVDDGTHDGLLLVTFLKETDPDITDESLKFQLKYY